MTSLLPTPEPADPVEGALGHFEHSNWLKASVKALDAGTVHKAGDTLTGALNVPELTVDNPANQDALLSLQGDGPVAVQGRTGSGVPRWRMILGDATVEGGSNSGTLFGLFAYSDAGVQLHQVLKAARSNGLLEVKGSPTAPNGVATKEYVDNSMPIGAIIAYGGNAAPTGWHICNGTAHGSAALQAVLGSANTPNLSDRFIIGAGTGMPPGSTGGVASNTLTPAQTATKGHSHTGTANATDTNHTHIVDPPATWSGDINKNHQHYTELGGGDHNHVSSYASQHLQDIGNEGSGYNAMIMTANWITGGGHGHAGWSGEANQGHAHLVDIGAFESGWMNQNNTHTHSLTVNATADANATAPIENRPPYYALVYIIKKV